MKGLPTWTEEEARRVVAELLPGGLDGADSCVCPGDHLHSSGHGRNDFRVFFTGRVPYGHCFHESCYEVVVGWNREMWRRLFGRSRKGPDMAFVESGMRKVREVLPKRIPYDREALEREQLPGLVVGVNWLRERSPVDPVGVAPEDFLDALYQPGERVVCFAQQWSKGDYGYVRTADGGEWVELGRERGEANVRLGTRDLPDGLKEGREGVWFLAQPVDGKWHLDPRLRDKRTGEPKWTRRSELAVTDWRFMVLESDSAPTAMWLNFLVQLPVKIVALYTSGGRSVHALLRVDAGSKAQWDAMRAMVCPVLSKLGADPATLTAVRLTRLPGCVRRGKQRTEVWRDAEGNEEKRNVYHRFEQPLLQRLLYLAPEASGEAIISMRPMRTTTTTDEGGLDG